MTIKNKRGKTLPSPPRLFTHPKPHRFSSNAYFVFVSLREETKTAASEGDWACCCLAVDRKGDVRRIRALHVQAPRFPAKTHNRVMFPWQKCLVFSCLDLLFTISSLQFLNSLPIPEEIVSKTQRRASALGQRRILSRLGKFSPLSVEGQ